MVTRPTTDLLLPADAYVQAITAGRRAKDAYFRTDPDSPLRRSDTELSALAYFPIDARYLIVVPRIRRDAGDDRPFAMPTSDGQQRIARRLATLDFELHGQRLTLAGYGLGSTRPGSLFVPFLDATSGRETYANGRYLDLHLEADGSVILDFNLSYQPYCAYSSAYTCPLAPAENRLSVPILAGERLPR